MVLAATARELVTRVREYIQDPSGVRWTDAQILRVIGQASEDASKALTKSGQSYGVDQLLRDISSLVEVRPRRFELRDLPETVQRIVGVWLVDPQRDDERPILEGALYDVPRSFSAYNRRDPIWAFTGPGYPGTLTISGNELTGYTQLRVWYLRRYPDLCYSNSSGVGITASTTTTATFPAAAVITGTVVQRPDLYVGMDIEFEATGARRRITAWDPATRTITFDTLSPAPTGQFSLVVPMPPETTDYLALKSAQVLALRMGNSEYLDAVNPLLGYAETRFREFISNRGPNAPLRTWNSRQ
jgi:hypothetical protein